MEDGDYNYQEALRKMLLRKENHRPYEEIIQDLQKDDAIGKKYKQNKDDAILLICVNG